MSRALSSVHDLLLYSSKHEDFESRDFKACGSYEILVSTRINLSFSLQRNRSVPPRSLQLATSTSRRRGSRGAKPSDMSGRVPHSTRRGGSTAVAVSLNYCCRSSILRRAVTVSLYITAVRVCRSSILRRPVQRRVTRGRGSPVCVYACVRARALV